VHDTVNCYWHRILSKSSPWGRHSAVTRSRYGYAFDTAVPLTKWCHWLHSSLQYVLALYQRFCVICITNLTVSFSRCLRCILCRIYALCREECSEKYLALKWYTDMAPSIALSHGNKLICSCCRRSSERPWDPYSWRMLPLRPAGAVCGLIFVVLVVVVAANWLVTAYSHWATTMDKEQCCGAAPTVQLRLDAVFQLCPVS